jgi:hypothetical protein
MGVNFRREKSWDVSMLQNQCAKIATQGDGPNASYAAAWPPRKMKIPACRTSARLKPQPFHSIPFKAFHL